MSACHPHRTGEHAREADLELAVVRARAQLTVLMRLGSGNTMLRLGRDV